MLPTSFPRMLVTGAFFDGFCRMPPILFPLPVGDCPPPIESPLPAVSGRGQHRIMDELTDSECERFLIRTESSRYLLELTDDGHRLHRVPGDGLDPVSTLRHDGVELELLHIAQCHLGRPAEFVMRMPDGEPRVRDGWLIVNTPIVTLDVCACASSPTLEPLTLPLR